jgi:hypothetical protein
MFLKYIVFSCALLSSYWSYAYSTYCDDDYYDEDSKVLDLMPGQKRCMSEILHDHNGEEFEKYSLTDLQEFKITKNGKHCLWGSKGWDEECQNVSLEHAYGERWPEVKELIINFIKHIKNEEYDKAIAMTQENACFFPEDNNLKPREELKSIHFYDRIYINPAYYSAWWEDMKKKGEKPVGIKFAEEFDITVLNKILEKVEPDNMKFYLADVMRNLIYFLMIPYEDENTTKYFYISIHYRWVPGFDDPIYYLRISHLGVFYTIPKREQ